MTREELIQHHSERAMAELDCALNARCHQASQAHFSLSALHLDRMRHLKDQLVSLAGVQN